MQWFDPQQESSTLKQAKALQSSKKWSAQLKEKKAVKASLIHKEIIAGTIWDPRYAVILQFIQKHF